MVLSRRESHEVVADAREREAVAARIGVEEVRSLEASVAVEKRGRDDVALLGELKATVAQKSVTTGDLVVSEVSAPLDVLVVVVVDEVEAEVPWPPSNLRACCAALEIPSLAFAMSTRPWWTRMTFGPNIRPRTEAPDKSSPSVDTAKFALASR